MNSLAFIDALLKKIDDTGYDLSAHRQEITASVTKLRDDLVQARNFDFREIGDSIYDGIYITDGCGKTLYVNQAYTRITGINPEEVLGEYVQDLTAKGL